MDNAKTMNVSLKNVYQLLISEMRYGYRRNNHLMPSCGYDNIKNLVPQMYEVDKEYAVYTMKQLCEECISDQLVANFYDGEDDEFGNRAEAIEFIKWSMQWINQHEIEQGHKSGDWLPHNHDLFVANLAKDNEPRYLVYELRGKSKRKKLITTEPVSQNEYLNVVFDGIKEANYRKETHKMTENYGDNRRSYTYHILSPVEKDFYVKHI